MLQLHEILGTDKPIFSQKENHHFYLVELLALDEDPVQYRMNGYVQVRKRTQYFYLPVYSLCNRA